MTLLDKKFHSCGRKIKFNSVKKVKNYIKMLKKKGLIVEGYNIYHCRFCNKYHLGHRREKCK